MRCEEVANELSDVASGSLMLGARARRHVSGCLRCQAEVAQYRKMLRTLRGLRSEVLQPGPSLVNDVLVAIEEAGERQAVGGIMRGRRAAYVGGIAAATAAAAAGGALVVMSISRRRVSLAG